MRLSFVVWMCLCTATEARATYVDQVLGTAGVSIGEVVQCVNRFLHGCP